MKGKLLTKRGSYLATIILALMTGFFIVAILGQAGCRKAVECGEGQFVSENKVTGVKKCIDIENECTPQSAGFVVFDACPTTALSTDDLVSGADIEIEYEGEDPNAPDPVVVESNDPGFYDILDKLGVTEGACWHQEYSFQVEAEGYEPLKDHREFIEDRQFVLKLFPEGTDENCEY